MRSMYFIGEQRPTHLIKNKEYGVFVTWPILPTTYSGVGTVPGLEMKQWSEPWIPFPAQLTETLIVNMQMDIRYRNCDKDLRKLGEDLENLICGIHAF
jgi:hypothetical protein